MRARAPTTSLHVLPETERVVLDAFASSIQSRPTCCSPVRLTTTCITRARSFGCAARALVVRAAISRKNASDVGQPGAASYATDSGSGGSCACAPLAIIEMAAHAPMASPRDIQPV